MRSLTRATVAALGATLAGAGPLWAHPGHFTEGGAWGTLLHALSSPYHVAVVAAVVVLGAAGFLASRPVRRGSARDETGETG